MILAIGGPDKSCKTSTALYFPKPMVVFEFDIATVERALRWRAHKELKHQNILRVPGPVQELKLLLQQDMDVFVLRYPTPLGFGPAAERDIRPIWNQFQLDFATVLEAQNIPSMSVDTATKCWWVCHTSYLQGLPPSEYGQRVSLKSVEYGQPNNLMSSLLYGVRVYGEAAETQGWKCGGKHLVLTHHMTDVYGPVLTERGMDNQPTGAIKLDGFKHTGGLIDLEIWMAVKPTVIDNETHLKPHGVIQMSSYALDMVGMDMIEPTYDKLVRTIGALS